MEKVVEEVVEEVFLGGADMMRLVALCCLFAVLVKVVAPCGMSTHDEIAFRSRGHFWKDKVKCELNLILDRCPDDGCV